ncbi:MAG: phage baseplate assembly protein V [Desulfovibrio sp.]
MIGIKKLLAPIQRRVMLMVGRAVVRAVADTPAMQELQVELLAGELRERVERFQQYGFSSHPHPGAEAACVFVGGNRDHGLILAVDDRRYRIKGLAQGEVAIYTDEDQSEGGHRLVLRRGGVVDVHCRHLNLHARESRTLDVAGYGETLTHLGGSSWHQDTYHEGATVTSTEHGIQPPEVPDA